METKRRRKQELKERRNYLPTVGIMFGLWIVTAGFLFLVDPQSNGAIPVFLLLIFASLTFTFSIALANTRRGMLLSTTIIVVLILRLLGMANLINIILLVSAVVFFELYFSKKF